MERTVADTIREITRNHLEKNNGLLMGQCITAVGWIQNTVPPHARGLVELPMNDNSGPGIAIGAAIAGVRPIFVLRFQSLLWLASCSIANHAGKTKELFGYPSPIFVRAIATDGAIGGPVHTNCFHAMFMNPPGVAVCAPMTPKEYEQIWDWYMEHDDPIVVSEHRTSYTSSIEMPDRIVPNADITIYGISASRFNVIKAVEVLEREGIRCNAIGVVWLKPMDLGARVLDPLLSSGCGLVIDSSYEIAGAQQVLAYELMLRTGMPVKALGMFDRTSGVAKYLENGTPTVERIVEVVRQTLHAKEDRKWT